MTHMVMVKKLVGCQDRVAKDEQAEQKGFLKQENVIMWWFSH